MYGQEAMATGLFMMTASLSSWVEVGPLIMMTTLVVAALSLLVFGGWTLGRSTTAKQSRTTTTPTTAATTTPPSDLDIGSAVGVVSFMTVDEITVLLRFRDQKTGGPKRAMCERLVRPAAAEPDPVEFLKKLLSIDEMKMLLRGRKLPVGGVKHMLSERLVRHAVAL